MISRKIFGIITIYCIVINAINCDKQCDDYNANMYDDDCKCVEAEKPHSHMLLCKGKQIENTQMDNIGQIVKKNHNFSYYALVIQETNVKKIGENTFAGFEFEKIFIEDNPLLTSLSKFAFNQTYSKYLVIRNNPTLNGTEIFELAKILLPRERIEFEGNNLGGIPIDFGNNPNIKYIYLQNNKIKTITDELFINLTNLVQIGLNNNNLEKIGFEFSQPETGEHNISVFLHQNKLNAFSFENLKSQHGVNVKLFLEDNNFTSLRKDNLENFLYDNSNELYLHNNNFTCTPDMKWVQDYPQRIHNVWCWNYDESIFRVTIN